jgi:hypothetical protein
VIRALASGLLAAVCAFAQLDLSLPPASTVYPPGAHIDIGTAATGDQVTVRFRVTNTSTASVRLDVISVSGVGFYILDPPVLPATLVSRGWVEFSVIFAPRDVGDYSANLTVNLNTYLNLLVGHARGGVSVLLDEGGQTTALVSGALVDFGQASRGSSVTRHFLLTNRNAAAITVAEIVVEGANFRGPVGITAPLTLAAGESAAFQVVWEPPTAGVYQGSLRIDNASVQLAGTAFDPPTPPFRIVIEPAALASGQQATLSLQFDSKSPSAASGLLRMDFTGKGDPSICFISPAGRSAPFTIREGEDRARFGEQTAIQFQTGTTAGTITFTATLGAETEQASIQIAPSAVVVDSIRATRATGSLTVSITAYDNTRSASQVAFTFYDGRGNTLGGGPIRADVAAAFGQYFENPEAGGAFVLRAFFLVTGNAAGIDSVDVELTNSAGASRAHATISE